MQVSFSLPTVGEVSVRSWAIVGLLVVAAILSSLVVELYKRHYFKKKDLKLAKEWTAALLTAASVFFTYLGYIIFLATSNSGFLSALPYVGKHFAAVLGIAYTIYNLRLSKWYNAGTKQLQTWSKDDTVTPLPAATAITLEPVAPLASEADKTFSL